MMRRKRLRYIPWFLFSAVISLSGCTSPPRTQEPSGRRLRAIVAARYGDGSVIIGATTGSWAFGTKTGEILDREFSYVTPENDFKQHSIYPRNNDIYTWYQADVWIEHIAANRQILRIHGPIGPQCSYWAQADNRTSEELDKNMTDFMTALCQRYNGRAGFKYLDVVNETLVNGNWHMNKDGTGGWECPWYKIGLDANGTPSYIRKAFEIAKQHAPNLKFIYNHHENPEISASWDRIKQTVAYLRGLGLRVDGIGWQAHVDNGWATADNKTALRSLIDWVHQNNLEFHVTEASVWLKSGVTAESLAGQAQTYRAILDVLLEKRVNGKVGWNTWHVDDGTGWHTEWHPALFDREFQAKPAYYAVQAALEEG